MRHQESGGRPSTVTSGKTVKFALTKSIKVNVPGDYACNFGLLRRLGGSAADHAGNVIDDGLNEAAVVALGHDADEGLGA